MKFSIRLSRWFRQWRRKRASRKKQAVLREFVYLDEVSVYSLIASRLGPIATEFTETETSSLQVEASSSLSAGVGIAKGEVQSHALSGQTQGSQVLRKSIVQTTFKELYELEVDSLTMRPISQNLIPPKIYNIDELITALDKLATDGWILDPEKLARGQLLEVEVQLEADAIFRVSAVVSALLEIVQEDPKMFGLDLYGELMQVKSMDRILGKLLTGLVPVRGHADNYGVVKFGEKEWIVHRKLLNELKDTDLPHPIRPLYIVGVAEQSLFWKDIRRVLFSNARFRVLCRMAQDGTQSSWTPIKLAHVLDAVAPGFANEIDAAGSGALAAMVNASKSNLNANRKQHLMKKALQTYAMLLIEHYCLSTTEQDMAHISFLSEQYCTSFNSQRERREAFEAIAQFLLVRFDLEREPMIVAQYRSAALADVGLDISGQPMPLVVPEDVAPSPNSEERFLDTEFVAIYW